jgi:hypothetical protein
MFILFSSFLHISEKGGAKSTFGKSGAKVLFSFLKDSGAKPKYILSIFIIADGNKNKVCL